MANIAQKGNKSSISQRARKEESKKWRKPIRTREVKKAYLNKVSEDKVVKKLNCQRMCPR